MTTNPHEDFLDALYNVDEQPGARVQAQREARDRVPLDEPSKNPRPGRKRAILVAVALIVVAATVIFALAGNDAGEEGPGKTGNAQIDARNQFAATHPHGEACLAIEDVVQDGSLYNTLTNPTGEDSSAFSEAAELLMVSTRYDHAPLAKIALRASTAFGDMAFLTLPENNAFDPKRVPDLVREIDSVRNLLKKECAR